MGLLPGRPAAVVTPLTFSRALPAPNKGGSPGGGAPTGGPTKAPDAGMVPQGSAMLTQPKGQRTFELHAKRYIRMDEAKLQAVADGFVRELERWAREISNEFSGIITFERGDEVSCEMRGLDPGDWNNVNERLLGAIGREIGFDFNAPLPAKTRAFVNVASLRLPELNVRVLDFSDEPMTWVEIMQLHNYAAKIRKALPSLEDWHHEAERIKGTVELFEGDRQRTLHPR